MASDLQKRIAIRRAIAKRRAVATQPQQEVVPPQPPVNPQDVEYMQRLAREGELNIPQGMSPEEAFALRGGSRMIRGPEFNMNTTPSEVGGEALGLATAAGRDIRDLAVGVGGLAHRVGQMGPFGAVKAWAEAPEGTLMGIVEGAIEDTKQRYSKGPVEAFKEHPIYTALDISALPGAATISPTNIAKLTRAKIIRKGIGEEKIQLLAAKALGVDRAFSKEARLKVGKAFLDADVPLSWDGFDAVKGDIDNLSTLVDDAIRNVADNPASIDNALTPLRDFMKAEGMNLELEELTKVANKFAGRFGKRLGKKPTVAAMNEMRKKINTQLKDFYANRARGIPTSVEKDVASIKNALMEGARNEVSKASPEVAEINKILSSRLLARDTINAALKGGEASQGFLPNLSATAIMETAYRGRPGTATGLQAVRATGKSGTIQSAVARALDKLMKTPEGKLSSLDILGLAGDKLTSKDKKEN